MGLQLILYTILDVFLLKDCSIMTILLDEDNPTIPAVQTQIAEARKELHAFLSSLTIGQREQATDAAGWTVKDHAIHLAVWEKRLAGVLTRQRFPDVMGIPTEIWEQDVDTINAFLQQRDRHLSWQAVMTALEASHTLAWQEIERLTDEDLMRPYSYYQPESHDETPIKAWVMNNTFKHYRRHLPWMKTIVERVEI